MTNREGADIQEARKYVKSKQSNINVANSQMTNSSSNDFSSSSNVGGPISSSRVSSARPMGATIEEAKQYNQQMGSNSSITSSTSTSFSSGISASSDLSSSEMQRTINKARKAVSNPGSGNMQ